MNDRFTSSSLSRRALLKGALAGVGFGLTGARALMPDALAQSPPNAAGRKPNVLFIAVDDLRPQLGCYGKSRMITPNIDALAARGLTFERAYCQSAICGPSRASLLSGCRPDTTRIFDLTTTLQQTIPHNVTLPRHFREHGYATVSLGKIFHNHLKDDPQAWDELALDELVTWDTYTDEAIEELRTRLWEEGGRKGTVKGIRGPAYVASDVPDDEQPDGKIALRAIDTLRRLKQADKPFFLAAGFLKPHLAFTAPKKYFDLYDPDTLDMADNPFWPKNAAAVAMHDWPEMRGYHGIPKEGPLDEREARKLTQAYYACVTFVDAQIGRVLDELDRLGLRDNTVVILWGDHGWQLGEHNLWGKISNFETGVRSPLIVSVPGQPTAGRKTQALTEFVDIYPSLAELCGLPRPAHLEGDSFAPVIADPDRPWKRAAFSQYEKKNFPRLKEKYTMGYSMRTDRYRYNEWYAKDGALQANELYDHQVDPDENVNLAGDPELRELVERLRGELKAGWRAARPSASARKMAI